VLGRPGPGPGRCESLCGASPTRRAHSHVRHGWQGEALCEECYGMRVCGALTGLPAVEQDKEVVLNKYSRTITQPKSQGASQAMLYATGLEPEDMNKAQVSDD
jgi:hypothetical protein